ncbi:protein-L-isoaspartate(D-aspartate) O-methyltransferase [Ensifer sp. YR511]|nr:protein-L-isoaspartate(D-aspartate) O-methyltransferase [Ensifer sp. YR511]
MIATSFSSAELTIIRRAFACQMMAAAGITDTRIEAAFAAVAREKFLGETPWQIAEPRGGYRTLPAGDPVVRLPGRFVRPGRGQGHS